MFDEASFEFARIIGALAYVNPFTSRRVELERQALGAGYKEQPDGWRFGPGHRNHNLAPLLGKVSDLLEATSPNLACATANEMATFRSLVRFKLYYEFEEELHALSEAALVGRLRATQVQAYSRFRDEYRRLHREAPESIEDEAHLFALCFQLRRAFEVIFLGIVGASQPAADLRASIWESVFTHDMRRYERSLYDRMHQMNTLIVGPSGTGKELVARAIGQSRYVPFDEKNSRFLDETHATFLPLNLSSLAPSLVESELFGHAKGSFTGATTERVGFLESCPPQGTVFLDEIGELSPDIQVKLLRTLQAREVRRIGENKSRVFQGKLVSATNRDLAEAVRQGRFREDFYYRLRADQITTPSLAAQLADCPEDLARLVNALAARFVPRQEVGTLAAEALACFERTLGGYLWPGNVRELEQAILSYIVHGKYVPAGALAQDPARLLGQRLLNGAYSYDDLSDLYVTLAYRRHGSYAETARQLELDRRTVKAKVRLELLQDDF